VGAIWSLRSSLASFTARLCNSMGDYGRLAVAL